MATGIFFLIGVTQTVLVSSNPMITMPFACLLAVLSIIALLRFGLLTFAVTMFVIGLLFSFPITADFSAWYAGHSLAVLLAVVALAAFAFHTSLGGQALFEEALLNE